MTTESKEKEPQACWEFMKCPKERREKCKVYKKRLGDSCWLIVKDVTEGCFSSEKYDGCINCPWFKKNNPKIRIF